MRSGEVTEKHLCFIFFAASCEKSETSRWCEQILVWTYLFRASVLFILNIFSLCVAELGSLRSLICALKHFMLQRHHRLYLMFRFYSCGPAKLSLGSCFWQSWCCVQVRWQRCSCADTHTKCCVCFWCLSTLFMLIFTVREISWKNHSFFMFKWKINTWLKIMPIYIIYVKSSK